jgi:hypothetical protein
MLNSQQIIIYLGLTKIPMPANAYYLMTMLIQFTQKDIYPTEKIYEWLGISFVEREAYNEKFLDMGMETTNFIQMLGSEFINICLAFVIIVFNGMLTWMAIFWFRTKCCRKMGFPLPRTKDNFNAVSLML